ncbi:MAG: hypothetical protein D6736_11185 [Nitrospinota bacterium]|nr:MAG: hypothetical protein D6736_11185 [Nitrospinota bacterium]
MIGVVTALSQESKALWQCCSLYRESRVGGFRLWEWKERGVVLESGMGREAAGEGATLLARRYPLRCLYVVGFAGGVAPELRTGDLVVGETVYCASLDPERVQAFRTDPGLEKGIREAGQRAGLRCQRGTLLTVDRVITDQDEKGRLHQRHEVVAVDMESGAVAAVAHRQGIPFLAVRIIFDTWEMSLPPALLALSDRRGEIRPGRVMHYLSRHPAHVPLFWRLLKRWYRAQQALAALGRAWWKAEMEEGEKT